MCHFPANPQGLQSLALFEADAHPHLVLDANVHFPIAMDNISGTFQMPVGLDGTYRESLPAIGTPIRATSPP